MFFRCLPAVLSFCICLAAAGCPRNQESKEPPVKAVTVAVQNSDPTTEIKPDAKDEQPTKQDPRKGAEWGTIVGRVVWVGPLPNPPPIVPAGGAGGGCPAQIADDVWIVDPKTKGLANTFAWLAPKDPKDKEAKLPIHPDLKAPPKTPVEMDQPACRFIPHALAMREGQDLIAKNSSAIAHNFKYTGNPGVVANAGANILLPPELMPGGQKVIKGLVADRLPIVVECNIHPWMKGYIRIFDHPYFAVTDAEGKFEIKNAPTGEYRLLVWNGSGGWAGGAKGRTGQAIEVREKTDLGDLKYPAPE